ncbi:MAG: hypothetical protein FIA97_09725 [Methylococcaceae bacterium]|nr:hypothetical protein [Methylococcaceae bacterium]
MLNKEIKNLPAFIALATGSLYVYGLGYHIAWLEYWGLEETMFPLSFDRTLFKGFMAGELLGALTLAPLLGLSLLAFLACWFFAWVFPKIVIDGKFRRLKTPRQSPTDSSDTPPYVLTTGLVSIYLFVALMLYMAILCLLLLSQRLGTMAATDQKAAFSKSRMTQILLTNSPQQKILGFPIICSSSHCAFWINGHSEIFPLSNISVLITGESG